MEANPLERLYQEEIYKIKPKVLVVIPRSWDHIQDEETVLLQKILNALKLSLATVQIIIRKEFDVQEFSAYHPSIIISFGSTLRNSDKLYENLVIDGVPIVVSHELRELDDTRKKNLWNTLKQAFHS